MIKRVDENTGREVRQLTSLPQGALVPYFRRTRTLPDGRIVALYVPEGLPFVPLNFHVVIVDPESGDLEFPKERVGSYLRILSDGRAAFSTGDPDREIWAMSLPDGVPELLGRIDEEMPADTEFPGYLHDVTCDGRTVVAVATHIAAPVSAFPDDLNHPGGFWYYIYRPRSGDLYTYDLKDNTSTLCAHFDRHSFQHVDPSPTDPTLIKFAKDDLCVFDQRAWTVRADGSDLRKIKVQKKGEWVHHEFWLPDGQHIGYKYVDRRNDPTVHELPWGELAPRPLQLGIADVSGKEVYLSDPLCCFQSHLNISPNCDMVSGEGTLDHDFVYAAQFSWSDYKIDLQPVVTTHTPYSLGLAQTVDAAFTPDSKWIIYNDTVDGKFQVFAVRL